MIHVSPKFTPAEPGAVIAVQLETDPVKIIGRAMKELDGTQPTVDTLFKHLMGTLTRAQIIEHAARAEEYAYQLMRGEV